MNIMTNAQIRRILLGRQEKVDILIEDEEKKFERLWDEVASVLNFKQRWKLREYLMNKGRSAEIDTLTVEFFGDED